MRNRFLLIITTALVTLVSSCSKDSSEPPPAETETLKVKTYTQDVRRSTGSTVTVYNVSYDAGNRLTAVIDVADPGNKVLYGYPSASLYTIDLYSSIVVHSDYFLNAQSKIDSAFQYMDTGDSLTQKYLYNASQQLTKMYEYNYSTLTGSQLMYTTNYVYDGSGNLLQANRSDLSAETWEYYAVLVKADPKVLGIMLTHKKANLKKSYTLKRSGNVAIHIDYTYTFDSKDRVSTITETYASGMVVVNTYTYY